MQAANLCLPLHLWWGTGLNCYLWTNQCSVQHTQTCFAQVCLIPHGFDAATAHCQPVLNTRTRALRLCSPGAPAVEDLLLISNQDNVVPRLPDGIPNG